MATTCYKVLDNTVPPMGARMLKRWIVLPLKDISKINERLSAGGIFYKRSGLADNNCTALIKQCGDIERLVSKIPVKKINPREVMQLAKGLQHTAANKTACATIRQRLFKKAGRCIEPLPLISLKKSSMNIALKRRLSAATRAM